MISVPGKIFIFGEYSVMNGGEAILATLEPRFQCSWSNNSQIHPESPAGIFLEENKTKVFTKIEGGLGAGFGSSTAELISANEYLENPWTEKRLWTWYRGSFAPASGADLIVQNQSRNDGCGFYHFQIQSADYKVNRVDVPSVFQLNCFLFHSPSSQKIPTHIDLETRKDSALDAEKANSIIHQWLRSFSPALLTEWADYLSHCGLESLFAHQVRKAFQAIPGVVGVKGCGAGLNDVFLVCVDQSLPLEIKRHLQEVSDRFLLKPLGNLRDHV
jgi:hypothetical protein